METLLKKPEIKRDENGRFEQHGAGLIKKSQKNPKSNELMKPKHGRGGLRAGAGRPKGSQNRVTTALKDLILGSLDELGGKEYLKRLAIENSSAFSSLLARVLPHTIAPASESDGGNKYTFTRIIVGVDGHRHIEGVTPKQLPAPEPDETKVIEP